MQSLTAKSDQYKISLAYVARLKEERKIAAITVSPYVREAFLRSVA